MQKEIPILAAYYPRTFNLITLRANRNTYPLTLAAAVKT